MKRPFRSSLYTSCEFLDSASRLARWTDRMRPALCVGVGEPAVVAVAPPDDDTKVRSLVGADEHAGLTSRWVSRRLRARLVVYTAVWRKAPDDGASHDRDDQDHELYTVQLRAVDHHRGRPPCAPQNPSSLSR